VSVYNTLAADQIRYIAENCAAKVAIVEDAAFLATWDAVRDQLPALEVVVVVDPAGRRPRRPRRRDHLRRPGGRPVPRPWRPATGSWRTAGAAVNPDDAVTLIYTSGTTGPPKGVVITHKGLLYQLAVVMDLLDIQPATAGCPTCPSPTSPSA
jgi:long-chain acyl-CoA synthetase